MTDPFTPASNPSATALTTLIAATADLLDQIASALSPLPASADDQDRALLGARVRAVAEVIADLDPADVPVMRASADRLRYMLSPIPARNDAPPVQGGNGAPPVTVEDMRAGHWQAVARSAGHSSDVAIAERSRLHDTKTLAVWTFERITQAPSPGFAGRVLASRPDGTSAQLPPGRLGIRLVPKS